MTVIDYFYDWKFWIIVFVIIMVVIYIMSKIITRDDRDENDIESLPTHRRRRRLKQPRYQEESESDEDEYEVCDTRSGRKIKQPRPLQQQLTYVPYTQLTPPPPPTRRYQPSVEPLPRINRADGQPDFYIESSRDAVPDFNFVNTMVPPPGVTIDFTKPLPVGLPINTEKPIRESEGEKAARAAMEKFYGVKFHQEWPDWLRNPKTGRRLQLDGVNHQLKIGFEYNGEQHYRRVPKWQPTEEHFRKQVERDIVKLDICDAHGYYIITFPYNLDIKYFDDFIRYYDRDAVMERERQKAAIYNI
jgi:hypothetical protein